MNNPRKAVFALSLGFLAALLSLAYCYKWTTLVVFGKVSAGIAYGYPTGFISTLIAGKISDYVGSTVVVKIGDYYFIPIVFAIDLFFWTILSGVVIALFTWINHYRRTEKRIPQ